jgi:hypothetical protein
VVKNIQGSGNRELSNISKMSKAGQKIYNDMEVGKCKH